jgi:anaerobic magnesium-protoporphyrin IX monomethyl ester cyclase
MSSAPLLRLGIVLDSSDLKKRADLLVRFGEACRHTGDVQAARAAYEAAIETQPKEARGDAQAGLGYLAVHEADTQGAYEWFGRAAASFLASQEPLRAAEARSNQACMLYTQGDAAAAAPIFAASLELRREHGDARGQLLDLQNLANCRLALGEPDAALELYATSAKLADELGDAAAKAAAKAGAGQVYLQAENGRQARRVLKEALRIYEALGNQVEVARAQLNLGNAAYQLEDTATAIARYGPALEVLSPHLAPSEAVQLYSNFGSMLYEAGELPRALAVLDQAVAAKAQGQIPSVTATNLHGNRGLALLAAGRFEEAEVELEAARAGYEEQGDFFRAATTTSGLSDLCRYKGDIPAAADHHRQVIELETTHGFLLSEPGGLLYAAIEDPGLAIHEAIGRVASQRVPSPEAWAPTELAKERPVLLLSPPAPGNYGPLFPRGATAIASFLNHHQVPALVLPLSHYLDVYAGDAAVEERTREVLRDAIQACNPSAIGISVTFTYLYVKGLAIARLVREIAPDIPIVFGGPHTTYWDTGCLEEAPEVDVIVRGEGEWTALELFRALTKGRDLHGVLGITWRDEGGVIHKNAKRPLGDVRELPPIDFKLLPHEFCKTMEITGLTSRGCKFKCAFCHEFRYWGTVVRDYEPQRIVDELERISIDYGNTMRGIDDSMLSMLDPRYFELCGLLEKSPHMSDRFNFLTRIDTISPEGLKAMKKAGISSMSVGLESGSKTVLKRMNKGFELETALESLAMVRDQKVGLASFFIIGHPGDNPVESEVTLEYVDRLFREELTGWLDLSIFTPYPGTPFFTKPAAFGVEILSKDWSKWRRSNRPIAQLTDYSASEIYLTYLRMLQIQASYHTLKRAEIHVGLRRD